MRTLLILVRKDFMNFFRNKAAVSLTFIVPFAMIWLFGYIFHVIGGDSDAAGIPLAVVNASDHPGAAKLVEALKREKNFQVIMERQNPDQSSRPLIESDLRDLMHETEPKFRFALVLPADFIKTGRLGLNLRILSNPRNEIETQTVSGLLQKTIFTTVPQVLGQSLQDNAKALLGDERFKQFNGRIAGAVSQAFGGNAEEIQRSLEAGNLGTNLAPSTDDNKATADFLSSLIKIDTEQVVGANVKNQRATGLVGGWAMQFLLFAVSASAAALFRERDAGLFQRLLAAPVTPAQILWSKFLYGVILGLVQLVVLFGAGRLLFGIEVEQHLGLLVLVCVFAAAACTAFGMLIAAFSPNAEAAGGLATFLIMLMSALGGAWFPISIMPAFIQQFSKLTIVYWSMEGFSAVLWAGNSFTQILPILGVLGSIVAVVMSVAVWRFNRSNLFG